MLSLSQLILLKGLQKLKMVVSKFEKMDEQDNIHTAYVKLYKVFEKHEKLYRLAIKKLSDVRISALKSYCMMLCMLLCMILCMT